MVGSFHLLRCVECEAERIVFDRVAGTVTCDDCGAALATPTGGKATVAGDIVETIEAR